MKKLLLILLVPTFYFGQQFEAKDMLTINKLSGEQFEAKYNLMPTKKEKDGRVIYNIESDGKSRLLTIQSKNNKIFRAQLYISNTETDDICSTLSYAFHRALKNEALLIRKTSKKIDVPYFDYDEFLSAAYDADKKKIDPDNVVKSSYKFSGSDISLERTTDKCSIYATTIN